MVANGPPAGRTGRAQARPVQQRGLDRQRGVLSNRERKTRRIPASARTQGVGDGTLQRTTDRASPGAADQGPAAGGGGHDGHADRSADHGAPGTRRSAADSVGEIWCRGAKGCRFGKGRPRSGILRTAESPRSEDFQMGGSACERRRHNPDRFGELPRYKHRHRFIRWGTKAIRQEVVSSNPHTQIVYTEYIQFTKKTR